MKGGALVETGSKMGNRMTDYGGEKYHSKREADYAAELNLRMRGKDIKDWRRQVKIPFIINRKKICDYIVDFEILHNDNTIEYIEVKGFETAVWKLKWKLFEALYPDFKKTIVK